MPKINLLPADLIPKTFTLRVAKVVNRVVLIGAVLFILTCAVLIALFIVNSLSLNNLVKNRDRLLTSIQNNQQTEQGLFLIRDRLTKIKTIEAQKSCGPLVKDLPQILASIPTSVTLNTASLAPTESEIVFGTSDVSGVAGLITSLVASSNSFSVLNLSSFTFTNTKGYSLGFGISK